MKRECHVLEVEKTDFRILTKTRYFFHWKLLKDRADLFKLMILGEEDILGVMAIETFDAEQRIEIKLLASSAENVGPYKKYDGIAGCLIAYAGMKAIKSFGPLACISLVPKTELKPYYIKRYGMKDAGWQLFMDGKDLGNLVKHYTL